MDDNKKLSTGYPGIIYSMSRICVIIDSLCLLFEETAIQDNKT